MAGIATRIWTIQPIEIPNNGLVVNYLPEVVCHDWLKNQFHYDYQTCNDQYKW